MKQWTKEIEIDAPIEHVWEVPKWIVREHAKDHAASRFE